MKTAKEAIKEAMLAAPFDNAASVHKLVDAMFVACKQSDEFGSDRELIDTLALLVGMACGTLHGYASLLEKEEA